MQHLFAHLSWAARLALRVAQRNTHSFRQSMHTGAGTTATRLDLLVGSKLMIDGCHHLEPLDEGYSDEWPATIVGYNLGHVFDGGVTGPAVRIEYDADTGSAVHDEKPYWINMQIAVTGMDRFLEQQPAAAAQQAAAAQRLLPRTSGPPKKRPRAPAPAPAQTPAPAAGASRSCKPGDEKSWSDFFQQNPAKPHFWLCLHPPEDGKKCSTDGYKQSPGSTGDLGKHMKSHHNTLWGLSTNARGSALTTRSHDLQRGTAARPRALRARYRATAR